MYKKIEFAKILSSSIEDDTDDVNKESELDLIDSLIKDVDLKKNYNSRYNFYINFIKMYQKDPNIIRYIYTKLNTIKNLNEKERDLLSKLNYTSYNSKGGGGGNPKNNILKSKIIELIKKIKISKIKNKDIVNNLRSDLKKLIINVYGNNIKEANIDNIVYKLINQKGGGGKDKREALKEIKLQVEELFEKSNEENIGNTDIKNSTISTLIKDITNKLYDKYEEINEINDEMSRNITPLIEDIKTITNESFSNQPDKIISVQDTRSDTRPVQPAIPGQQTLPAKPPTIFGLSVGPTQSGINSGQVQFKPQQSQQQQQPQKPQQNPNSSSSNSYFSTMSLSSSYDDDKKKEEERKKEDALKKSVDSNKNINQKEYLKVIKVLQKHYELKNLANFNNKNFSEDDDYITDKDKNNTYDNTILQFNYDIDKYNNNFDDDNPTKSLKDIKDKLISFENNPSNPYLQLSISFEDRLVFIITTFFIRYLSLILIQWCVDINIIRSFEEGFIYYAVLYISIFWFFVLFVNIDNSFKIDYMNIGNALNSIRSLFYYFYMGTNGITKLLVHSCLICVIIVIPVILNIKKNNNYMEADDIKEEKLISYEDRKKLSKSLSLFTIFLWILTSIIATKF
jgi:hypothetical protein